MAWGTTTMCQRSRNVQTRVSFSSISSVSRQPEWTWGGEGREGRGGEGRGGEGRGGEGRGGEGRGGEGRGGEGRGGEGRGGEG